MRGGRPGSPGVSWSPMLFAIEYSNPSVSVFATRFKTGSGGQELMMDFIYLFIYLFCLLANLRFVGFSSSWKIVKFYRERARMKREEKSILVVMFHVVIPSGFPCPVAERGTKG